MTTRLPTAVRNAMADTFADRVDLGTTNLAGKIRIYSGAQPASADDAASGSLLAEVDCANPALDAAGTGGAGVVTLLGVPLSTVGTAAAGAGTEAGYFRMVDRDTGTAVDGSVGTSGSGAELIVNTTTISENVAFDILSGTWTMPSGE